MSSDMRKKWRSLRKKRNNTNMNNIEYDLRSNKNEEDLTKKEDPISLLQKQQEFVLDYLIKKSSEVEKNDTDNDNEMVGLQCLNKQDFLDIFNFKKANKQESNKQNSNLNTININENNNASNKSRFQCKQCNLVSKFIQKININY